MSFFLDLLDYKCVCTCIHTCTHFVLSRKPAKSTSKNGYFSNLPAVFILATVCAQLSHFGSSSRLWGQSLGIGGEDQMTFRNSDEVLPLLPSPSPPFPGSQLWNKEGKNSNLMKTSSCCCRLRLGAGGLLHLSLCFATLLLPFPQGLNKTIFLESFVTEWCRNKQFAPYLGVRRWMAEIKLPWST